jgi:zinc protease
MLKEKKSVFKQVLPNGLTVLCCPKKNASKTSIQLWYDVGSKHEGVGERGMAHFIEHMIFKGTERLSESDINMLTHKLSGYCNAFTSYDYTAYLFDVPTVNWQKVFPVLADCMRNCRFDEEHLFSEVKAVIQELKMYRDDFDSALIESIIGVMFDAHPYHHPIIGYKQDLWSLNRETLYNFYQKYYAPQNAALVVVGDVEPEDVFKEAAQQFSMVVDQEIKKESFFVSQDIGSKSVQLVRDVQQSVGTLVFKVPGAREKKEFYIDVLQTILTGGKTSRLHKILVDEQALATSVQAFCYDLYDQGLFFILYKPKHEKDLELIKGIIFSELQNMADHGVREDELLRSMNKAKVSGQHLLEDVQRQAYDIGKSFFATGDGQYAFDKYAASYEETKQAIEKIIATCMTQNYYCYGSVISATESQKTLLSELQELSDREDNAILSGKERVSEVAPGRYVHEVSVSKLQQLSDVDPEKIVLKNGMTMYVYRDSSVETAEMFFKYKAGFEHDPAGREGVSFLMSKMLVEGTKKRPEHRFAEELESYGMSLSTSPGLISMTMLGKDAIHAADFFVDMVKNAAFDHIAFARVLEKAQIKCREFWDTPNSFIRQLARTVVYRGHPCSNNPTGTIASLAAISHQDVVDFYTANMSPQQATCALVGDISPSDITAIIELFEQWTGPKISEISYPKLEPVEHEIINHYINRDQVVLAFAGSSIDRKHPDYYKILIFDQIFAGGVLSSMNTRLFQLREQSGLFYTIGGSLVSGAYEQPGMIFIKTIVSKDRLEEAKKAIFEQIDHAIDTITDEEIAEAKEAIINTYPSLFDSNGSLASTFLFLDRYGFDFDYFNQNIGRLRAIEKSEIVQAVKKILHSSKITCLQAGRI